MIDGGREGEKETKGKGGRMSGCKGDREGRVRERDERKNSGECTEERNGDEGRKMRE